MLKAKHSLNLMWILLLRNEVQTLKETLSLKQTIYYCMAIIFAMLSLCSLLIRQANVVVCITFLSCACPLPMVLQIV